MSNGALPLSAYPSPTVILKCRRCDREGRFEKAALTERVSPDEALPTLRLKLAAGLGCELARASLDGDFQPGFEQCGAHYPELLIRHRERQPRP
jgi:hypothetical protein